MSTLDELQAWYHAQCDGDWEHSYGVEIGTLDNPGWRVRIDLAGTALEGAPFEAVEDLAPERAWYRCWVEGDKFQGAGGPGELARLLRVFLDWAAARPGARPAT